MSLLDRVPATRLVHRHITFYRKEWLGFSSGFVEPVFYLFSIGVGVGSLISTFAYQGHQVPYAAFVAPGMLASSAMNGAVFDSTFNFYFRLRHEKLYESVLATPMRVGDVAIGELTWCLIRSGTYSAAFVLVMVAMGLTSSWWTLLALPAALLIGLAMAGIGMASTTWMRSWQDFEFITLTTMPMFLFSATFFPIETFPSWVRWVIEATPLYRGVVLCRELTTGLVTWASAVSVVYLVVVGALGLWVVSRRLDKILLH